MATPKQIGSRVALAELIIGWGGIAVLWLRDHVADLLVAFLEAAHGLVG